MGNKSKIDGTSDYAKTLEELKIYKKLFNMSEIEKLNDRLQYAEHTLRKVHDLINSNEDLVHFYTTKNEIRKPIEEYFEKVR